MIQGLRRWAQQHGILAFAMAALVVTILGAKWHLIRHAGSDVPFMDQWDAEAQVILIPSIEGRLTWQDFWWAHNEHRIIWTKLLALGEALLNRQWDPLFETWVNAGLHALVAACLLAWARRFVLGAAFTVFALLLAALFAIPFDWENTLQGFQSQFYFLALFSFLTFRVLIPAKPFGPRWWGGLALAVASLGTMSSGFMAVFAVFITLAVRTACERRLGWREALGGILLAAVAAAGALSISHVPGHDELRVASFMELWRELNGTFGWPTTGAFPAALVMQLPLLAFAWTRIRARKLEGDEAVLFAFGAWCAMQAAALAFARGHFGAAGSPRYSDMFVLGTVANAIALTRIWPARHDIWRRCLIPIWLILAALGLKTQVEPWSYIEFDLVEMRAEEKPMLRRFMATENIEVIRHAPPKAWPHPTAETLADVLTHPGLRPYLPPGLRPAVPIRADEGTSGFDTPALPVVEGKGEPDIPIWSAQGPARFVSTPLPQKLLPVLRFYVRGSPTLAPANFRLETEKGARVPLSLNRFVGDRWQTANVEMPKNAEEVRIVADIPAGASISFAGPIELGRGSYYARHSIKAGNTMWIIGLASLILLILISTSRQALKGGWQSATNRALRDFRAEGTSLINWFRRLSECLSLPQRLHCAKNAILRATEEIKARPRLARWLGWGAIGVALFVRKPDALLNPQLWAEDGEVFLLGHSAMGFSAWVEPYAGYLHLLPRIIASVAGQFDPLWWPLASTSLTFILWWVVIARCWSPRIDVPGRAWLPLPFFVATLTAEILYNMTNLQWISSFVLIQQLFMRPPHGRLARVTELALLILIALTGPFCLVLWPVYCWDAWRKPRDRYRIGQWLVITACVAVQVWFIKHDTNPPPQPPLGPMEILKIATAGGQRLLAFFLGRGIVELLPAAILLLGGLGIGGIVLFLLSRVEEKRLWLTTTAIFLLLFAAGLYRSRLDQAPLDWIGNGDRYFFGPRVLLGWMLIWTATKAWKHRKAARSVALVMMFVHLPNFRFSPYTDLHWERYCDKLRRGEAVEIPIQPEWTLIVPAKK